MKKIDGAITLISKLLNYVSFICFAGIMFFIVIDVVLRYVLNKPILGSYEIVEQLMLCGVFCAFAYAQTTNTHIHISMILVKLPRRARRAVFGLGELASAGIGAVLCIAILQQANLSVAQHYTTAILKFTTSPFLYIAVVATAAFVLTLLLSAVKNFIAVFNGNYETELEGTIV